jgi:predicted dehydrogenase
VGTSGKIRVGIVGVQMAGTFHYETLKRVYGIDVDVVGVTSNRPETREEFAQRYGIRAFESVDAMIDAVDVVDICAPPYVHEPITVQAAEAGKHIIVEKPFTGSFLNQQTYDAQDTKDGTFNEQRYREAVGSAERMVEAVRKSGVIMNFAENWHFLPAGIKAAQLMMSAAHKKVQNPDGTWVQGELDPAAQVLYIRAEGSHSGSGSPVYGDLQYAGGGSVVGKTCHPMGFVLYLKRLEGIVRHGKPIEPVSVSGHISYLTMGGYQDPDYQNPRKIRSNYVDGEDWSAIDIVFSDDTRARIEATDIKLGGVYNWFEVFGNKFFVRGNVNPSNTLQAYAPSAEIFEPEYLVEKLEFGGGFSNVAVDENMDHGYQQQMQIFFDRIANPQKQWEPPLLDPAQDCDLALDSVKVMYAAYISAERGSVYVALDDLG